MHIPHRIQERGVELLTLNQALFGRQPKFYFFASLFYLYSFKVFFSIHDNLDLFCVHSYTQKYTKIPLRFQAKGGGKIRGINAVHTKTRPNTEILHGELHGQQAVCLAVLKMAVGYLLH